MASRAKTHRASAQRRRAALLQAAAELAAEVGAGAVTHRAVAARAGVPLSTTSYFFSSIDELVTEALRNGEDDRGADFDAVERAAMAAAGDPPQRAVDAVVECELGGSRTAAGTHVEFLLAAGRQPELRDEATAVVTRYAERMARHLDRSGAPQATDAAWTLAFFGEGELLYRLAGADLDHAERLRRGLRLVLAAAQLGDDELDGLLDRYRAGGAADEVVARA